MSCKQKRRPGFGLSLLRANHFLRFRTPFFLSSHVSGITPLVPESELARFLRRIFRTHSELIHWFFARRTLNPNGSVILVVDDDEILLRSIESMLRRAGYWTISASGPLHALNESRDFQCEIHLLLTDIAMPEMDGSIWPSRIAAERGTIRVLLMSGYTDGPCWLPLLRKPFRMAELLEKVRTALDGSPPLAIQ